MQEYTNVTGVPLSVAAFLANDSYDHDDNTISATGLMRPIRQSILAPRVPTAEAKIDLQSVWKSRQGTAIHDAIERVWTTDQYKTAMKAMKYPDAVIDRIVVNPDNVEPNDIPVYLEQRLYREFMGYNISGKFDFIGDGTLEDFKSTSVFTWIYGTKTDDYALQGSIYRWLDSAQDKPKITSDHITIQFFFTDWVGFKASSETNYPANAVMKKDIPLLSLAETEQYITAKLTALNFYDGADESDLPNCSDKDLWRKPPVYKYYKNKNSTKRSTKNFDSQTEAYARMQQDNNVGMVKEVPGQVVACRFCPAFPICTQKDEYLADGTLII
jgi:hypothetical protein